MSKPLPETTLEECREAFALFDLDKSNFIEKHELQSLLAKLNYNLATYQVRDLIEKFDVEEKDGKISFQEFIALYEHLYKSDFGNQLKDYVKGASGVQQLKSKSDKANADSGHFVLDEEIVAFSNWITKNLQNDPECADYLPLRPETRDIFHNFRDGILLCKIINMAVPNTIHDKAINKGKSLNRFKSNENLVLGLNSAKAIGCNVVSVGAEDFVSSVEYLIFGVLWQIIRLALVKEINLQNHAELAALLREGEELKDLLALSPEELLIRWVNYHLEKAGCSRRIANFSGDIKDSEIYANLLQQISPAEKKSNLVPVTTIMSDTNLTNRAGRVLDNAEKLDARDFVTAKDIVNGNPRLNFAFVANLFNKYPALTLDEAPQDLGEQFIETREEKTYRNWMNSLGVKPFVNYLYTDLIDGLIFFQLYERIQSGSVNYARVTSEFKGVPVTKKYKQIENCNYVVELGVGKPFKFVLVGIDGKDIYEGKQMFTLAILWQLMRAYSVSLLSKLVPAGSSADWDRTILNWMNERVRRAGFERSCIKDFNDAKIADSRPVFDLIEAIQPNTVREDQLAQGSSLEVRLENARLAIGLARKLGAGVYCLPEDICELNRKMIMTMFASIQVMDMETKNAKDGACAAPVEVEDESHLLVSNDN